MPRRYRLSLPLWCPASSLPLAALARPAPGERTISNAEVPLPRSPLSLADGSARREPLPVGFAPNWRRRRHTPRWARGSPPFPSAARGLPSGYLLGRLCKCRRRFNARGAGGGNPRRNKLIVSPFPTGEGGRGNRGQERKLKAGAAGNQNRRAPPTRQHSGRSSQCRVGAHPPPSA